MFGKFENPRRGMQARNLTTNVPKILDIKSSFEQIFSKNCRWVPLFQPDQDCGLPDDTYSQRHDIVATLPKGRQ